MTFIVVAISIFIRTILDLPVIETRLFEMLNKEETNVPTTSICNALEAPTYALPKSKFIIISGKKNKIIKAGRFIISTHLDTCFLNSLILLKFFLPYSLFIIGKKSCLNNSYVINNNIAIGVAEL